MLPIGGHASYVSKGGFLRVDRSMYSYGATSVPLTLEDPYHKYEQSNRWSTQQFLPQESKIHHTYLWKLDELFGKALRVNVTVPPLEAPLLKAP